VLTTVSPQVCPGFHHREHRDHRDRSEGRKGSDPDPNPFPSGLCGLCALCGETPDRAGGHQVPRESWLARMRPHPLSDRGLRGYNARMPTACLHASALRECTTMVDFDGIRHRRGRSLRRFALAAVGLLWAGFAAAAPPMRVLVLPGVSDQAAAASLAEALRIQLGAQGSVSVGDGLMGSNLSARIHEATAALNRRDASLAVWVEQEASAEEAEILLFAVLGERGRTLVATLHAPPEDRAAIERMLAVKVVEILHGPLMAPAPPTPEPPTPLPCPALAGPTLPARHHTWLASLGLWGALPTAGPGSAKACWVNSDGGWSRQDGRSRRSLPVACCRPRLSTIPARSSPWARRLRGRSTRVAGLGALLPGRRRASRGLALGAPTPRERMRRAQAGTWFRRFPAGSTPGFGSTPASRPASRRVLRFRCATRASRSGAGNSSTTGTSGRWLTYRWSSRPADGKGLMQVADDFLQPNRAPMALTDRGPEPCHGSPNNA